MAESNDNQDRGNQKSKHQRNNPSNMEGIHYLAIWNLERQNYQQARKHFIHLTELLQNEPEIWLSLSVCYALSNEVEEGKNALQLAQNLLLSSSISSSSEPINDPRVFFCQGMLSKYVNVKNEL